MCSSMGGDITGSSSSSKTIISRASLWPLILERAHSKSAKIYDHMWRDVEDRDRANNKKCATGLFHLVCHFYGPLLAEDCNRETVRVAALSTAADAAAAANCAGVGNNNDALENANQSAATSRKCDVM